MSTKLVIRASDNTSTERSRRHRARQRAGKMLVSLEIWPNLVDALETFYGIDIDTADAATDAIIHLLSTWETGLDRTAPHPPGTRPIDDHRDEI